MNYTQRITTLPNGIDRQEIIKADSTIIVNAVLEYYDLTLEEMRSISRKLESAMARHFIHYYLVVAGIKRKEISYITLRDLTMITHSRNNVENWVETDKLFRARAYAIGALIISNQQKKSLIQSLKNQTA